MGYLNLEWLFFLPLTLPLPCCWVALVALILGFFLLPWKKLSSWQAKSLSLVGRLGLVKHVLSSMPLHIAMVLPLPKSVCYSIESCFRNFLWSVEFSKSRANYFSWDKVCLPISEGGLGIRRVHEFDTPCFIKLGWNAVSSTSLWASWFWDIYIKKGFFRSFISNCLGSCIWKNIKVVPLFLLQGLKWSIGNGKNVNL